MTSYYSDENSNFITERRLRAYLHHNNDSLVSEFVVQRKAQ